MNRGKQTSSGRRQATTDERIQKTTVKLLSLLKEINELQAAEAELNSKPKRSYQKFSAQSPSDAVEGTKAPQIRPEELTPSALKKKQTALIKQAHQLQTELLSLSDLKQAEIKQASQSYKMSAHLLSQTIKIPKPKAPTLFDYLDNLPEIQQQSVIETYGGNYEDYQINGTKPVEIRSIAEGVNVKATERKLIDALCLLLHTSSNNTNEERDDYYTGNKEPELVKYPELRSKQKAPRLSFTLYEIAKAYHGKDIIGGFDLENTRKTLEELSAKSFLIRYERKTYPTAEEAKNKRNKKGQQLEYIKEIIETYEPLVRVITSSLEEYYEGEADPERTTEILVQLSPIFRDQINSYFIRIPQDLARRTHIAHGNKPPSKEALRLRDYCIASKAKKKYTFELNIETLCELCASDTKPGQRPRWHRIRERVDEAIKTCKRLGLITDVAYGTNATGGDKFIFQLAKDWPAHTGEALSIEGYIATDK
jgi:hypothetical protein